MSSLNKFLTNKRRHIRGIGLQNFRVFEKDNTFFDFAPINILIGKNSSGKSSLIKSILLLADTITKDATDGLLGGLASIEYLSFDGDKVEHHLGSFWETLNKNNKKKGVISFYHRTICALGKQTLSINIELQYKGIKGKNFAKLDHITIQNLASKKVLFKLYRLPQLTDGGTFEIKINYDFWEKWLEVAEFNISTLEQSTRLAKEKLAILKKRIHEKSITEEDLIYIVNNRTFLTETSIKDFTNENYIDLLFKLNPKTLIKLLGKYGINKATNHVTLGIDNYSVIKQDNQQKILFKVGSKLYKKVPVNIIENANQFTVERPSKNYHPEKKQEAEILSHYTDRSGIGTHNLVNKLIELFNSLVNSCLAPFNFGSCVHIPQVRSISQRNYQIKNSDLTDFDMTMKDVNRFILEKDPHSPAYLFIKYWLKEFELADDVEVLFIDSNIYKVYLVTGKEKTLLADNGYGYSQLLPILFKVAVQAAKGLRKNSDNLYHYCDSSVIMIEEPEISLHPSLQSKLVNFFIDAAARFNIQFIVETHSEYIIRRLQLLTALELITPKDVNLYYFNYGKKSKNEENYWKIEIDEDGRLSRTFGEGFIDESEKTLQTLYHLYTNKHKITDE